MTDPRKRTLDEESESSSSKKQRAPDGSPIAASRQGSSEKFTGKSSGTGVNVSDIIAKARAVAREKAAAARLAAGKSTTLSSGQITSSTSPSTRESTPTPAAASAGSDQKPNINIEEVRAQIAAHRARIQAAAALRSPSTVTSLQTSVNDKPAEIDLKARGGLNIGMHPALLNDIHVTAIRNKRNAHSKQEQKKVLRLLSGPSEEEVDPSKNPYFDPNIDVKPRERNRRTLEFNEKGKYIDQANALRKEAKLEELKKRIQESSKKAGFEDEFDSADRALKREVPPDVEWWDQGLVINKTYNDVENDDSLNINVPESVITIYVQHPVPISAPWEKNKPILKPPHLTKKEMKRIRKSERAERHKEKQDRIRLGLDPAPPPKVKLSNLMNVLTNEAIKDPTLVEQRVRREVEERKQKHIEDNLSRKLTSEQRSQKLKQKLENDEIHGIVCAVFRIENLSNPQHRFKISINAQEMQFRGVLLLNPKFNLVVVEGGQHAIRLYKKLLLNRIDWTENAQAKIIEIEEDGITKNLDASNADLSRNSCVLVWEGEVKQHSFKRWSVRHTESEIEVREILDRSQSSNYWNLAKNWTSV
ncbi:pre-mRNA processing factor 3-domain-containing protein [Dipodascopsis uninucleata]